MAELVLFVDSDFGGLHTHIFESTADFTRLALGGVRSGVNGTWNDIASSFVIISGRWQFFKDVNFKTLQGNPHGFGPGLYGFTQAFGIDNDSISSVRLVG